MATEENNEEKMEKIAVVVRVRPLLKGESTQRSPWKLSSKSIASSKTCRPSVPCYSFTYDRVYGTKSTTLEIYEAHVKGIINSAVSGVSGTIIAYGQPGSGKTSTMRGLPEEKGVLILAVQDVFNRIQEEKDREFLVRVSYFELENEELVDLLASTNQKLDVHENAQGGIFVTGLREEIVVGTEQVLALVAYADARRFVGSRNANDCRRRPHSIFQMVIESRLDNQETLLIPQASDEVQISVLNLVEVAAANAGIVDNDGTFLEKLKPEKSLITLQRVMSKLSENGETKGESLPYSESKLTYLLKPSLGGNTRTCLIFHVSPAMVHMDGTVETLAFAAKATRVMNCFKVDEFWRSRSILKRQRRELEEPRNKVKIFAGLEQEEDYSQELEDVVNRQNALLMIELEREQMSIERFGKQSLLCESEIIDQKEDKKGEILFLEGDFNCERRNEMQQDDSSTYSQTKALCEYIEKFRQNEELQDVDHLLRGASGELWLSPRSGSKRKRGSSTGKVAKKFEQVELLFQSKMGRGLNFLKAEGIAERQLLTELRNLIEQQDHDHQEHLAQRAGDCKTLQQKIAELEREKVMMENRLCEQETIFHDVLVSLKGQVDTEGRQVHGDLSIIHSDDARAMMDKRLCDQETTLNEPLESLNGQLDTMGRQVHGDLSVVHSDDALNEILPSDGARRSEMSQNEADSKCAANVEGEVQESGLEIVESVVKHHAEAQSCISQESEEQQNVLNETDDTQTYTKRKSKAKKVCQKYQNFQGRSDISSLRQELAVANETISALKDERDGLWRDLKQINESRNESEDKVNVCTVKEDINGDNNSFQFLAAAVDELKAEVESTLSITDALLELVLESFQTLNADLKSFQEGVAELKVLSCATSDLSESLEKAKMQLVALRQGKLSSEKELHSMKSELAKLECVVERQSGVLRVLSDNESLLNELSSVKAVMKEAASASELRLSALEQEYKCKLEDLESQREIWKHENLELEEKYSDIQCKLQTAQSEVHTLTQALEKTSELEKKQTDVQLKFDVAETDALRLTQALEKSKIEKKKKCSKSRQSTTEAEILRLTHSLGEKAGLQEEVRRLQAELSSSQTEVERLEREVEENDNARQKVLIKLKSSEHTVSELTAELQEKERVEVALGKKLVWMENEVVKVTKLLEDTLTRVESQQRELIISRGKAENLAGHLEEMNTLENNYSKTLDRLVQSETEVARLTEIITRQLEDKSILEQDHTNFMYKLESLESEVDSLTTRLNAVLQEKVRLETESMRVSLQLANSESEVAKLTENVSREKKERTALEESHRDILDKLGREQEQRKLLDDSHLKLNSKLIKEQQEKEALEEIYQEIQEKLTRDQEVRKKWEEMNLENVPSSTHTQKEVEVLERKHEGLVANLADLETKVNQLNEKLAAEAIGKSELENKLHETLNLLAEEQEQRKCLEEKNQDVLKQFAEGQHEKKELLLGTLPNSHPEVASSKSEAEKNPENLCELEREQDNSKQLNKAHQDTLEKLAASQSEVTQLSETLSVRMQEYKRLEIEHLEILNTHRKNDEQDRNQWEVDSRETRHEATAEEQPERVRLEEIHHKALQFHRASEPPLIQWSEILDSEFLEENGLQNDRQQSLQQEERRTLERKNLEILENMIRDEEQKRERLEEINQSSVENPSGSEADVVQLRETVTRKLGGKNRLDKHHQEMLATLSREQQERRELEAKYEETLTSLTMAIEERDGLAKAQQNLRDKLAVSEAKVGQMAETLSAEVQDRLELQHKHQEIIELTSDREGKLIQSNEGMAETLRREREEAEMLKNNHQNCVHMLASLEGKVVELKGSLASEAQIKENLELECKTILMNFERLETEVVKLTENLARELQSNVNLEKHHNELLAQVASSNAVVARVNANLADEVAEKEKLRMHYAQKLTQFDTSKLEVDKLTKRIQDTSQGTEELYDLQLKLAVSEAKLLRQADEQRESNTDEHKLHMVELDATRAEIKGLGSQNERLQQENAELLAQVSVLAAETRRLTDEVGEKGQVEEHKDINVWKTEISTLENALREKSKLEVEQQKLQLELLSHEGEISRLTKALRASRKVVKEQKHLIRNLTSNQAEVLRLTTALGERSGSSKVYVEQNTGTDPSVTGIPCCHCEPQSLLDEDHLRFQKRLVSAEAEVARLLNIIEDKALVESKWANAQLELTAAEGEIARLTVALKEKMRLEENLRKFHHKLSEAGLLSSRKETNDVQFSLEEFPSELIKLASRLEEIKREVEIKEVQLSERERSVRDREIGSDVDYVSLSTIITLREKERDELRERCTVAESKVHDARVEIEKHKELCAKTEGKVHDMSVELQKHKDLEIVEKKVKARCHKAEKDAVDLRAKLQKLEEATSWLVRDKNLLEERLNCCEMQLTATREAARSANKELEMSHHQLHVRTTQHQSEIAALCDELSVKKAQNAELEAELNRLLGQPHQALRPLQEAPAFLANPHFRLPQWTKRPGSNLDQSWGTGNR